MVRIQAFDAPVGSSDGVGDCMYWRDEWWSCIMKRERLVAGACIMLIYSYLRWDGAARFSRPDELPLFVSTTRPLADRAAQISATPHRARSGI